MGDQTLDNKIDHLTPEYYKARRGLMLFSALLIAWELIGIELSPKLNIDSLNLDITIKSPQAAPAVLFILVIYFSIRTAIEWYQSHPERRKEKASIADIYLTVTVVISSLIIITIQFFLNIQIAEVFSFLSITIFFVTIYFGAWATYTYKLYRKYGHTHRLVRRSLITVMSIIPLLGFLHGFNLNPQKELINQNEIITLPSILITFIYSILALILGAIMTYTLNMSIRKIKVNQKTASLDTSQEE